MPALIGALGSDAPARDDKRYFRMSRAEALRIEPTRLLDDGQPLLDQPPSVEAAVLLFADTRALCDAEEAARGYARALWAALGRAGAPPTDVIWRISGAGSSPSSYTHLDADALREILAIAQIRAEREKTPEPLLPAGLTGAFSALARLLPLQGLWPSDADPVAAFLRVWMTGFGVWSVEDRYISLFAPERSDAPARWSDIPPHAKPERQKKLDLELIRCCSTSNSASIVALCLSKGADPNAAASRSWGILDVSALHAAARCSNAGAVRELIAAGADPGRSVGGCNALAAALSWWRALDIAALLDAGLPIDAADLRGRTALHQLCIRGHSDGVEKLIKHEASIDCRDVDGLTPLHLALAHAHWSIASRLIRAGADPHAVSSDGQGCYHFIARNIGAAIPEDLRQLLQTLAATGAAARPDRFGWPPHDLLPAEHRSLFPTPGAPTEIRRDVPLVEIEPGLSFAALRGETGAWEVLGDWLQEQGDPRGQLVAMSFAEDERRLPRGSVEREASRLLGALLSPFLRAHPLGAAIEALGKLGLQRGTLASLELPERFAPALPALLDHVGCQLLGALSLALPVGEAVSALPGSLPIRSLTLAIREGGEAVLPSGLPLLESLHIRAHAHAPARIVHRSLRSLTLERPRLLDVPWEQPVSELDAPSLSHLSLRASGPVDVGEPGWRWLLGLLDAPPRELSSLGILPVSGGMLSLVVGSAVFQQLQRLHLAHAEPIVLDEIETLAEQLSKLDTLDVSVVSMLRAPRIAAQQRLSQILPNLRLKGATQRLPGSYA